MSTTSAIKPRLAFLFSQMALFQPEMVKGEWTGKFLVNQNNAGNKPIPDRDDLLNMIGSASNELVEFIREHKQTVDQAANATKMIVETFVKAKTILGDSDYPDNFTYVMGLVFERYTGLLNTLHSIAHDIPADKAKEAALKFLAFKPERFEHLVN